MPQGLVYCSKTVFKIARESEMVILPSSLISAANFWISVKVSLPTTAFKTRRASSTEILPSLFISQIVYFTSFNALLIAFLIS